jgi:hypothetical protein
VLSILAFPVWAKGSRRLARCRLDLLWNGRMAQCGGKGPPRNREFRQASCISFSPRIQQSINTRMRWPAVPESRLRIKCKIKFYLHRYEMPYPLCRYKDIRLKF